MYIYVYTQLFCSTSARLQLSSYKVTSRFLSLGCSSFLYTHGDTSFKLPCCEGYMYTQQEMSLIFVPLERYLMAFF